MASKESDGSPHSAASTLYSTAAGRLVPPLGARLPPPSLHSGPYPRPHEFYRSLYSPAAAQHLAAASGGTPDASLLETYQRTLGANLIAAHSAANAAHASSNSVSSVFTKANPPGITTSPSSTICLPLGLTSSSRMSPSSTSSLSSGSETPIKPVAVNKA